MSEEREALREKLLSPRKNGYDRIKAEELQAMERYCGLYKTFLQQGQNRARVRPGGRGAGGKGGLQAL